MKLSFGLLAPSWQIWCSVLFLAQSSSGSVRSWPVLCGAGTGLNFWGFVLFWVTYFWLGLFPVVRKEGLSLEPIELMKFLKLHTSLDSYKPCRACQKVCGLVQGLSLFTVSFFSGPGLRPRIGTCSISSLLNWKFSCSVTNRSVDSKRSLSQPDCSVGFTIW